jgi:hypothetical protein
LDTIYRVTPQERVEVHRESDPSAAEATLVVVRAGQGEPVINVDGPG